MGFSSIVAQADCDTADLDGFGPDANEAPDEFGDLALDDGDGFDDEDDEDDDEDDDFDDFDDDEEDDFDEDEEDDFYDEEEAA
jgi:hypothetical protein